MMLYTWLSTSLAVVALLGTIWAVRVAILATKLADDARAKAIDAQCRAEEKIELTPDQATLLELAGEVTNIKDGFQSLHSQLKRINSRLSMREKRERDANGHDQEPTDSRA